MQPEDAGFAFRPGMHEPGAKVVMGRSFGEGRQGGLDALAFLGTHAATYRSIATRLVRHFVADDPPADAVGRVDAVLRRTGGDLRAASAAVVDEPGARVPLTKLRTPAEHMVAVMRAAGTGAPGGLQLAGAMEGLGQPLWAAPLPNGWPDRAADWAGPESLMRRAEFCYGIAGRMGDADPEAFADAQLGDAPRTRAAMQHAGSRREALTLAMASPEFMRR